MRFSSPKPVLQDSYPAIGEADIARFEAQIESQLPKDYRDFLLTSNGGIFPKNVAAIGEQVRYQPLEDLYGLNTGDCSDLYQAYTDQAQFLFDKVVPIGTDGMGNEIGIVIAKQDYGSICFFDHEVNEEEQWPPSGKSRIANSFSEFIDAIVYDPFFDDDWCETIPAFKSAEKGDAETLGAFLDLGYAIESRNEEGDTLLICAAGARQSHIVKLLLDRGADIEARDASGRTALICASYGYSLDSVKLLLNSGANINAEDDSGNSALLLSVCTSYRVPLYLIQHGADVNHRNNDGNSALDLCGNYSEYLREPLIQAGAME